MEKPQILNLKDENDNNLFLKLRETSVIVDEIAEQIRELEFVKDPTLLASPAKIDPNKEYETVWVFYPWKNTLVHCLNKADFKLLRSSRNRDIINQEEQDKFEKFRIGIAGLNVGNPGAVCIGLEADIEMKLTDNDVLSLSNLNRFRAGLPELGLNKAVLTARQIYEVNPFAGLETFEKGISTENIDEFLLKPKIDILVEEMDNLPLKIKIRELARENKIPVVMVTGSGPDVIIDVERFDIEPELPLMSGYLKKEVIDGIRELATQAGGSKSFEEKIKLAKDFMGEEYLHPRLAESFKYVGSKLAGIPQIAESSFLRGASISYFVRQIAQGADIKSGRYIIKLSDVQRL
jgi:hypothetical protein